MPKLSADQAAALRVIADWYKDGSAPYLVLGGYAGTGKTSLIAYLRLAMADHTDAPVAFCAPTGMAARRLNERLKQEGSQKKKDSVSTLHSLIYSAETDSNGHIVSWKLKDALGDYGLIILDEASMVTEGVWNDLLSFKVPVLAVGDHGQLPPVGGRFSLMENAHLRLERIWRQASDSPILQLASMARTSGHIPSGDYGAGVRKLRRADQEALEAAEEMLSDRSALVLCGYNHTRQKLNRDIRARFDIYSSEPVAGDRVVCLRNNHFSRLYNGMTGTIRHISTESSDDTWYWAEIELDGEDFSYLGYILKEQFGAKETIKSLPKSPDGKPGDLFDFGYALTVHKAQGSQAEKVLLFEERFPKMTDEDWRRWLYTGVTRAERELLVVG